MTMEARAPEHEQATSMPMNPLATMLKFPRQIPIYNWYYPFWDASASGVHDVENPVTVFAELAAFQPRRRAVYFHIPFCETICSFCPFVRGTYTREEEIERYVQALIKEMAYKQQFMAVAAPPVDAIYVGGGTPSLLQPDQIRRLGEAIHAHYRTDTLREFTFECEVKSVTVDKLQAMREIGVSRISFGAQTFNPKYRELFELTATVDQIRQVAAWTNERFPYTNMDLLYGMAGQTLDDVIADVNSYLELETTSIDCYPLNNGSTQRKLHTAFRQAGLTPLSANTKMSYRLFINEYMRAQGHVPINGYSYAKQEPETRGQRVVVQHSPVFHYFDIVYGYGDECWDGYGAGAFGQYGTCATVNIANREEYMNRVLSTEPPQGDKHWFGAVHHLDDAEKGIIYLPYRGTLDKARIDWDRVHPATRATLAEAVTSGLARETDTTYEITEAGWFGYVDLQYALMPPWHRQQLDGIVKHAFAQGRDHDDEVLYELARQRSRPVPLAARAL